MQEVAQQKPPRHASSFLQGSLALHGAPAPGGGTQPPSTQLKLATQSLAVAHEVAQLVGEAQAKPPGQSAGALRLWQLPPPQTGGGVKELELHVPAPQVVSAPG